MEKLKEIDNFMKFFPQNNLEEVEQNPSKRHNKKKNLEFLTKNGDAVKASSVNEINQKLNEKMSKIRAPKKEKKKKQRGKVKIHADSSGINKEEKK